MRKKKIILEDVEFVAYAAQGKAIARPDGKVLFVEGAVPGDIADVLLTKNKKDWAEGRLIKIKIPSPDRIVPVCKHFGICGGCKWQMLPYSKQLEYKQQEVKDIFQKIGKLPEPSLSTIIGSEKIYQYRNKLEFTFSNKRFLTPEEFELKSDEDPGNSLGYHVPRLFDKVINITECHLMDDVNNIIRNEIRDFALQNNLPFYDIKNHTGWLRTLMVRYTTTGECMINIVIAYRDEPTQKMLLDFVLKKIPSLTTVLFTINPKLNDTIYDLEPEVAFGPGFIYEVLGDYRFKISPKSFFQTNTLQAKNLYDVVKDYAGLSGSEIVYDLYCGTGSIGIYLSDQAKKIIGVEAIDDAVKDAKENATLNGVNHAEFFTGDVIKICNDEFFNQHGRPDVVILDPPRAGLHGKLIEKLLEILPEKIVYVSCNVSTQARDLQLLNEHYEVKRLQPVDMFPHTHHIECVAELVLREYGLKECT